MGWKSLIFTDENKGEDKQESKTEQNFKTKFPTKSPVESKTETKNETLTTPTKTINVSSDNPSCGPHLERIMDMYEKGFDSLNLDGYDFYEFFKAVIETGGVNNPSTYSMALTMAKAMDKNVTKDSLLQHSKFYMDEILSVHQKYVNDITKKRDEILNTKGLEESTLTNELADIEEQLDILNNLKKEKSEQLSSIDKKYESEITDIECKGMANDMAKDRIIGTIQSVVDGINKNIQ